MKQLFTSEQRQEYSNGFVNLLSWMRLQNVRREPKAFAVWKLIKLQNILYGFKSLCSCVVKGYREEVYISCAPYIFAMAMKCIISISISNLNDHVTFIWGFLMLLLAIICQTFLSNCQRTPHEVIMWMTRRNQIVKTLLFAAYNFALVINSFNIFMW